MFVYNWFENHVSTVVKFQKRFVDDVAEKVKHQRESLNKRALDTQQRAIQLHLDHLEEKYLCCVCGRSGDTREDESSVYDTFSFLAMPARRTIELAVLRQMEAEELERGANGEADATSAFWKGKRRKPRQPRRPREGSDNDSDNDSDDSEEGGDGDTRQGDERKKKKRSVADDRDGDTASQSSVSSTANTGTYGSDRGSVSAPKALHTRTNRDDASTRKKQNSRLRQLPPDRKSRHVSFRERERERERQRRDKHKNRERLNVHLYSSSSAYNTSHTNAVANEEHAFDRGQHLADERRMMAEAVLSRNVEPAEVQHFMYKIRHAVLNREARHKRKATALHRDRGLTMIEESEIDTFSRFFQRPVHGYLCDACNLSAHRRLDCLRQEIEALQFRSKNPLLRRVSEKEMLALLTIGGEAMAGLINAIVEAKRQWSEQRDLGAHLLRHRRRGHAKGSAAAPASTADGSSQRGVDANGTGSVVTSVGKAAGGPGSLMSPSVSGNALTPSVSLFGGTGAGSSGVPGAIGPAGSPTTTSVSGTPSTQAPVSPTARRLRRQQEARRLRRTNVLSDNTITSLRANAKCGVCGFRGATFFVRQSVLFICFVCTARDRYYRDNVLCLNDEAKPREVVQLLTQLGTALEALQQQQELRQLPQTELTTAETNLFPHQYTFQPVGAPGGATAEEEGEGASAKKCGEGATAVISVPRSSLFTCQLPPRAALPCVPRPLPPPSLRAAAAPTQPSPAANRTAKLSTMRSLFTDTLLQPSTSLFDHPLPSAAPPGQSPQQRPPPPTLDELMGPPAAAQPQEEPQQQQQREQEGQWTYEVPAAVTSPQDLFGGAAANPPAAADELFGTGAPAAYVAEQQTQDSLFQPTALPNAAASWEQAPPAWQQEEQQQQQQLQSTEEVQQDQTSQPRAVASTDPFADLRLPPAEPQHDHASPPSRQQQEGPNDDIPHFNNSAWDDGVPAAAASAALSSTDAPPATAATVMDHRTGQEEAQEQEDERMIVTPAAAAAVAAVDHDGDIVAAAATSESPAGTDDRAHSPTSSPASSCELEQPPPPPQTDDVPPAVAPLAEVATEPPAEVMPSPPPRAAVSEPHTPVLAEPATHGDDSPNGAGGELETVQATPQTGTRRDSFEDLFGFAVSDASPATQERSPQAVATDNDEEEEKEEMDDAAYIAASENAGSDNPFAADQSRFSMEEQADEENVEENLYHHSAENWM